MSTVYSHRQTGWGILISVGMTVVFIIALSALLGATSSTGVMPLVFVAAVLAVMAVLFSSLTIEVGERDVSWYFGPRFWPTQLAISEIEKATAIKTKWYWGYGMKFFGPGRWLYTVSGTDGVELTLRHGGWVRLGTDDVAGLMQALRARGL